MKFFLKENYKLRLAMVQPKESDKKNRIHLRFEMPLDKDKVTKAPSQIRAAYNIVSHTQLEIPDVPIATKVKGLDLEIFATPPDEKVPTKVPILVTLSNCILRDLRVHRLAKGEINLIFSVGLTWDKKIWKWAGEMFSFYAWAKFYQSQTELLDDSPADESLEVSAELLDGEPDLAASAPAPVDPLAADLAIGVAKRRARRNGIPLHARVKSRGSEARR